MRYVLLNAAVLVVLAAVLAVVRVRVPWRVAGTVLAIMLLLTLIFDNVIIGAGLVAYDPHYISGVKAWLAPAEDFAYTLGAVMVAALIWHKEETHAGRS